MNQQAAAIVIAGGLIAAASALTNHWALFIIKDGSYTMRLNRWTGSVVICTIQMGIATCSGDHL